MSKRIYDNFFSTTVVTPVHANDTEIVLGEVPSDLEGYLVLEPHIANKREIVYFHDHNGLDTIFVQSSSRGLRGSANVGTGTEHSAGAIVEENVTAQHLAELEDVKELLNAGKIQRTANGLEIKINGWKGKIGYRDVHIEEQVKTLDDNSTYYVEFKPNNNEADLIGEVIYTVAAAENETNWNKSYKKIAIIKTVSGQINEISGIEDRREFGNVPNYEFIKSVETDAESALIINQSLITRSVNISIATDDVTTEEVGNVLQVKDGGISNTKLSDGSVSVEKIIDGAVNTQKLSDGSVTNAKINDAAITDSKIRIGAVTGTKIPSSTINSGHIQDGAITNAKLANAAVTEGKINTNAVNKNHIKAGQVVKGIHSLGSLALTDDVVISGTGGVTVSQDGNKINIDAGNLANVFAKADIDYVTPTDGQTIFTLNDNVTVTKGIRVRLNGVFTKDKSDWEVTGNSFTWKGISLDDKDELSFEWFRTSSTDGSVYNWIEIEVNPTTGQTSFTLSSTPEDNDSITFNVNNVPYTQGDDWTISGTTITWLNNDFEIAEGDEIKIRYIILD